jgi:hypothetical protein
VKLALELPDQAVPGEQVSGAIRVEEGGESRSLTLTVAFHEETRDYSIVPVSSDRVVHQGELVTGQTVEFTLDVPTEAPPSVKCENSELWWEVSVHSADPGFDTHVSRRLEVVAG